MKPTIDKLLQKDVLAILLKDNEAIYKLKRIVNPDYFTIRAYRYLYKTIIENHDAHGEILSKKLFLLKLNKLKDEDKKKEFRKKSLILYSHEISSSKGLIQEIKDWAAKQKFGQVLEQAANEGFKGNVEKGKELIKSSFLFDPSESNFKVHDVIDEWKLRQKERKILSKQKIRSIPLGLGIIDDYLVIHKNRSQLVLMMGTSGVGKSITVINIGVHAISNDCNVAHFVFENTERQTIARYDSRLIKYPYSYISQYEWNEKNLKLANRIMKGLKKRKAYSLKVIHAPIDSVSVSDVEGVLRDIEIREGWKPGMIIYDSLDHMIPSVNQESYRLNVKRTFTDAKRQSEIRDIPIISSTHAKASARGNRVRQESFSESYDKVRLADAVITISQTQEEEDDKQAEFWLDKSRDSEGKVGIIADLLFRVMTIRVIGRINERSEGE